MDKLKIKVCGMRDPANIAAVEALRPDYLGFIFVKTSPRFVGEDFDPASLKAIPHHTKLIGVFMDQPAEEVGAAIEKFKLPIVQLHGVETQEYCLKIKSDHPTVEIIKAFSVGKGFDIHGISSYHDVANYMLFDTGHGGTGAAFDWNILSRYRAHRPFFLAGGIGPEHCAAIKRIRATLPMLMAVDLNRRFEPAPGMKSASILSNFIRELRA